MNYNIIIISDLHWGVIEPDLQCKYLEFIKVFIKLYGKEIDLLVILGDYFDNKLSLNSPQAIWANEWFHSILSLCKEYNIKIRMVQGTSSHDNDQLEVFSPLTDDMFQIFFKTTLEETLPDLKCIYCPDETIETSEYEDLYLDEILSLKDIGFFHGSFDVVYGELLKRKPELLKKNNVIFRYDLWNKTIYGPMIAGHWHDGKQYDNLYYCGTPFRYEFGEEEPKGILFVRYNTENHKYYVKKVLNPLCAEYITYEVYTNLYNSKEDYQKIIDDIRNILKKFDEDILNLPHKLKIVVYVLDDKTDNDVLISSLRSEITRYKNVKLKIKNKLKDKLKKEQKKKNEEVEKKLGFIYDSQNKKPYEIIHDFILETSPEKVDIPMGFIKEKCKIGGK